MREIDYIVLHCSATREDVDYSLAQLTSDHKRRGFRTIGYHYYIQKNGTIHTGRPIEEIGAHVRGYNRNSIAICYEGGLDADGKPKDTRTEAQQGAILSVLLNIIEAVKPTQPVNRMQVLGHRDLSPDQDGDGVVEAHEWLKDCPCFDAKKEYGWITEQKYFKNNT